jgi:hypothetical protein
MKLKSTFPHPSEESSAEGLAPPSGEPLALNVGPLARVLPLLEANLHAEPGPTLVQAGHFSLVVDPSSLGVVPGIATELDIQGMGSTDFADRVRDRFGTFPEATWSVAVDLVARLRQRGGSAGLSILVNDWSPDLRAAKGGAESARSQFYGGKQKLPEFYQRVLENAEMSPSVVRRLQPNSRFFTSETWLRRRIQHDIARLVRENGSSLARVSELQFAAGTCSLRNDEGPDLPLLRDGRAGCLGEVAAFVGIAAKLGYRNIVDFVPAVCEDYVSAGTRAAMMMFGLEDVTVLNVACYPMRSVDSAVADRISVRRVVAPISASTYDAPVEDVLAVVPNGNVTR